ncbi:ligase-associated DNA damage response exonuclease [Oceanibacterium hippocampi]|uniref:Ribonuclease n=1 Tax=Oceanibacterium hippocampi TaxID=745714 RepID=A0A1Y5S4J1_9PROT|nr:ligase-associated DNA damage response exonuclease [Oceanibacterium hippocampi]SLN29625.1 Ribonuclease [Oceanibacterium hippocampi]
MPAEPLLTVTRAGLYVPDGDFHIDPTRIVPRAVITHGHADHARAGHGAVLATAETLAIMEARMGPRFAASRQALRYGERAALGGVSLRLLSAGHVLGSAQAVIEKGGVRAIVTGDFKRRADPAAAPFELVEADHLVTEATFGLPVFRHPPAEGEVAKLLQSLRLFPARPHLVGAYSLGKAQRLILLLRAAGYDLPIYCHDAVLKIVDVYRRFGYDFGSLRSLAGATPEAFAGAVAIGPPERLAPALDGRTAPPVTVFASGWLGLRARARRSNVMLPLVISDHADWDELTRTIDEVAPARLWVMHGAEAALVHHARLRGIEAGPLPPAIDAAVP